MKKIICIVLIIFLLGTHSFVYANSLEKDMNCEEIEDEIKIIDVENLTEALSVEELQNNKCIERITELENDLHSLVYKCIDGNFTEFIFQNPIKYITDDGHIKDISLSIRKVDSYELDDTKNIDIKNLREEYKYSSEENTIKIFYSDNYNQTTSTVVALKDKYKVGIKPISVTKSNDVFLDGKSQEMQNNMNEFGSIEYKNLFGNNDSLFYHTTYTGYKELIQINSQPQSNVYEFELIVDQLEIKLTEFGEIQFVDPLTKETIATMATLFVYDSSEEQKNTLNNSYEIKYVGNDKYIIKLIIDDDFLTNKETVYPIMVDPTFSFVTSTSIDDAPIYSGKPTVNHGANYYNHIGYVDSAYGTGSLMVKFPALKNSVMFNGLSDIRINLVKYNVKKVGGNNSNSATVTAYKYLGPNWNEDTVTYNSAAIHAFTGSAVTSTSLTGDNWYSFNITQIAKEWKNGTSNYDLGLIIKNTTNTTNVSYERVLASAEYGTYVDSNSMPYISIVYNNNDISGAFSTLDLAAKDFAQSVYSSSEYLRIEYAATLYKYGDKYYYYNVHIGYPHSVTISQSVPSGALYMGYIHTHPNSEDFSAADRSAAAGVVGYVVTPSYSLKKYNSSNYSTSVLYTGLAIYPLTMGEKSGLVGSYNGIWYNHFVDGICPGNFHCESKIWPNG